jgi:predicted NodU family carbamoyl transferase
MGMNINYKYCPAKESHELIVHFSTRDIQRVLGLSLDEFWGNIGSGVGFSGPKSTWKLMCLAIMSSRLDRLRRWEEEEEE